jgi:hypothetical protein
MLHHRAAFQPWSPSDRDFQFQILTEQYPKLATASRTRGKPRPHLLAEQQSLTRGEARRQLADPAEARDTYTATQAVITKRERAASWIAYNQRLMARNAALLQHREALASKRRLSTAGTL